MKPEEAEIPNILEVDLGTDYTQINPLSPLTFFSSFSLCQGLSWPLGENLRYVTLGQRGLSQNVLFMHL